RVRAPDRDRGKRLSRADGRRAGRVQHHAGRQGAAGEPRRAPRAVEAHQAPKRTEKINKTANNQGGPRSAHFVACRTPHPPTPSPIKREGVGGRKADRRSEGWGNTP